MPRLHYPVPQTIDAEAPRSKVIAVLKTLGRHLGYKCPEDWYDLSLENLATVDGLVERIENPIRAARLVHPELNPLLFQHRKP